jgi:hypothetical protein
VVCPISLGPPVAPQITPCGHIFSFPAIIQHLVRTMSHHLPPEKLRHLFPANVSEERQALCSARGIPMQLPPWLAVCSYPVLSVRLAE